MITPHPARTQSSAHWPLQLGQHEDSAPCIKALAWCSTHCHAQPTMAPNSLKHVEQRGHAHILRPIRCVRCPVYRAGRRPAADLRASVLDLYQRSPLHRLCHAALGVSQARNCCTSEWMFVLQAFWNQRVQRSAKGLFLTCKCGGMSGSRWTAVRAIHPAAGRRRRSAWRPTLPTRHTTWIRLRSGNSSRWPCCSCQMPRFSCRMAGSTRRAWVATFGRARATSGAHAAPLVRMVPVGKLNQGLVLNAAVT